MEAKKNSRKPLKKPSQGVKQRAYKKMALSLMAAKQSQQEK